MTSAHTYRHDRNSRVIHTGGPLVCPSCAAYVEKYGNEYHCQPCGHVWDADGNVA